ncbi:MAG TPA: GNAT family N-acetyltransferase [Candidatus Sulfotelmatobacter sp.]|jgi:RimJ/RimL family protein N-acetyltransferase|nr:GNAT family N-acetyltransferase [Candidatus Sulfotelmatobacter sp.]
MSPPVVLRGVVTADLPVFYEHQRDPESLRLAAFTPRDWDAFRAHWEKILAQPDAMIRAIVAGGTLTGYVLSFERFGKREVGYWIGREHWGRGIATAALVAFLEIERSRPLHARIAEHNVGSIRVVEKCGFAVSHEEDGESPMDDGVEEVVLKLT